MSENKENKGVHWLHGLWIQDRAYNIKVVSVLLAIEMLLAYSPFGYIVLPKISITTMYLGVLIAALWGGPFSGAAAGLIFGLTSMWKASVTAVNPSDLIFSPIRSGDPMGSVVLALGPRVLFGIVAGLMYYIIMKTTTRSKKVRIPLLLIASAVLERVQSMLTYLFMDKVFHVEGAYMGKAWTNLLSSKRLQTFATTMVVVAIAYIIYEKILSKKYYEEFSRAKNMSSKYSLKYLIFEIAAVVVVSVTALHLWERIQIVLFDIDQILPEQANVDLIAQVIFQFMAAAVSALYIVFTLFKHARNVDEIDRAQVLVQLDLEKERAEKMEQSALRDPLTGVYNRKGQEKHIADAKLAPHPVSFLLIDIDHFKEINDNFGHDVGDLILKETAKSLLEIFGEKQVFRIGGDEFSVLTDACIADKWDCLTAGFKGMHERISALLPKDVSVTLSVGACCSEDGYAEKLYLLADSALYETKSRGRAGFTLVDENGKVLSRWKDPDIAADIMMTELSYIGVSRMFYWLDGSEKTQLFCSESVRNQMCVPMEATPEECFELWAKNIAPEDQPGIKASLQSVLETGAAQYTYIWNHPIRGRVKVESAGTGKVENGVLSLISHHQAHMNG